MGTVIIAVPTLARHDAVGNDARLQQRHLALAGHEAHLYAARRDPGVDDALISDRDFERALQDPQTTLLYHFCVYWDRLEALLKSARCKVVAKFHNVTPPSFYMPYDRGSVFACEQGLRQAQSVFRGDRLRLVLATSPFTAKDLTALLGKAPTAPVAVQPPFVPTGDLDAAPDDPQTAAMLADGRVHAVFVGRFSPNKGHKHLVGVASAYRELYGPGFQLTVAGKVTDNLRGYHDEVIGLVKGLGLQEQLKVLDAASLPVVATLYRKATATLVLSEHEGFCVPVIESQHLGTPVIAYAATAVGETAGEGALTSPKLDYDFFATALHGVATRPELRQQLALLGRRNAAQYAEDAVARSLLQALAPLLRGA
jgi:glycosyltransferase involved in cell wall biosynthesis